MLQLESFMHKRRLAEILARWMIDRPRSGDVRQLKEIVNFNLYASRIWIHMLASDLFRRLYGGEPKQEVMQVKGKLKDFVVDHPTYVNERIEEMRARYRRFPEDFYREAPIDGSYYTVEVGDEPIFVGSTRIKRFRRIAEKGSRRIVDFLLARIRATAELLAEERAERQGVPRHLLRSTPETMRDEFCHAERRVIKSIKRGTIHDQLPVLGIPDVVGIKLIDEGGADGAVRAALQANGTCKVVESELHSGRYNAVNLRVEHALPRELLLASPPSGRYFALLASRGLEPDRLVEAYYRFVDEAEDTVGVELIVSTFQEFLESEIGRSMHEERVLTQRAHPDYAGHLATNIRYLLIYVLGLCHGRSSGDLLEVPIKLWVKYMPDTVEKIMRRVYNPDEMFFDTPVAPSESGPVRIAAVGRDTL